MADKVVLSSIDIDVDKALADAQKLREEVIKLKEETTRLKQTQGETSQKYIIASAQLKATQTELNTLELNTLDVYFYKLLDNYDNKRFSK